MYQESYGSMSALCRNPLAGWAFTEPDNWCLDEDCAALGMDYIENYSTMKFGPVAMIFNSMRTVGFFDISCNTQLHCLCQAGGKLRFERKLRCEVSFGAR